MILNKKKIFYLIIPLCTLCAWPKTPTPPKTISEKTDKEFMDTLDKFSQGINDLNSIIKNKSTEFFQNSIAPALGIGAFITYNALIPKARGQNPKIKQDAWNAAFVAMSIPGMYVWGKSLYQEVKSLFTERKENYEKTQQ